VALQDAARDIKNAHFCVAPHYKPPTQVPTTFRAPSVSIMLRTPDCIFTNPEDVAGGRGQPRLTCDGDGGGGLGGTTGRGDGTCSKGDGDTGTCGSGNFVGAAAYAHGGTVQLESSC
jgi:hypothetical protein